MLDDDDRTRRAMRLITVVGIVGVVCASLLTGILLVINQFAPGVWVAVPAVLGTGGLSWLVNRHRRRSRRTATAKT